jgi:septal ring-binding cell division protein DamX
MEVDELGSGLMMTPAMPEKERTDAFPKVESLELNEEDFVEETEANSISGLELEQEKIMEEAQKELPDEELGDEKTVPPLREEEYFFDQKEQLYQQEIPPQSDGKKSSPLFVSIGILVILVLIGGGYFYFFQSGEPSLPKKVKVALNKKETTSPQPVFSPQAPVAEKQKEPPETLFPQLEEVKPPPVSEKTEEVVPEALITKSEPKKEGAPPVSSAPAKPQEKPTNPKASKEALSKTKETTLPAPTPAGQYSLMVGAFKVEGNAIVLKDKLQKKGYHVTSYSIDLPGKGSWYRVIVGNYADVKEARKAASTLKGEEKISALIMKDGKYL